MDILDLHGRRPEHPVDLIEQIASRHAWAFERDDQDEISIVIAGSWCDYHVSFTWLDDMEALHLACSFDLKVPERRRTEIIDLIGRMNAQMWVGHFDLWSSENAIMFRHALVLSGGTPPSPDQCEALIKVAVEACEKYYQAFQFVVWAGKTAPEALETILFETAGEA